MPSKPTSPAWTSTTADPDEAGGNVELLDPRRRFMRDEATHFLWICYGLTQAVLAVLLGFGVITSTDPSAAVTAVALILYVAVNELLVRPRRVRSESTAAR